MNEPSGATTHFKIWRQDTPEATPFWDLFKLPYKSNLNVSSCL